MVWCTTTPHHLLSTLFVVSADGICTCDGGYPSDKECTCGKQAEGREYLLGRFLEKNDNDDKDVYFSVTCATDTENVKTVFEASKSTILKANLMGSGFM